MIAFCFLVLAVVAGGVVAGYAGSSSGNDLGHGGSGDSYGYGYSGSFSGGGPPPNFGFPAFDFSGFLGSLGRYHDEFFRNLQNTAQEHAGFSGGYGNSGGYSGGYGGSFSGGNDNAFGGSYSGPGSYSYSTPNTGPRVYPERTNFYTRGSFGESGSGGAPAFGQNSGAASSSASVGPQGVHQTAAVYPVNPNSPNINTRFAAAPSGGGGGFRSVFTSSESHTSNVGGKPVTVQKAVTTVNDNGKITTYTANNP